MDPVIYTQYMHKKDYFVSLRNIILKSLIGMTSLLIYAVYRVGSLFIFMCGGSKGINVDVERVNVWCIMWQRSSLSFLL